MIASRWWTRAHPGARATSCSEHGHVDLEKVNGKWHVRSLALDAQARAEAQGQAEAFAQQEPLDSDHAARV